MSEFVANRGVCYFNYVIKFALAWLGLRIVTQEDKEVLWVLAHHKAENTKNPKFSVAAGRCQVRVMGCRSD